MKISECKRLQWTRTGKKLDTIPAWDFGKVKIKKEVILEVRRDKKNHFAALMDKMSPQKCGVGTRKSQQYKGRVVLRGDIVKNDSGTFAVFSWTRTHLRPKWLPQKQLTLLLDNPIVTDKRLTQCRRTPRRNWRILKSYFTNPKSECLDVWIRLPKHKWPKSWEIVWKMPSHLLNEIYVWSPISWIVLRETITKKFY